MSTAKPQRFVRHSNSLSSSCANASNQPLWSYENKYIYTRGRPPWYSVEGEELEPLVIGLCGGSASGKTTVARKIFESINVQWISLLTMDSFYNVLSETDHEAAAANNFNFDHPDSFDFDLLREALLRLRKGKSVEVPVYDFTTHSRLESKKIIYGANVVIFEGIMSFDERLLDLLDIKIFVDTDDEHRLERRLRRDIRDRGRDLEGVMEQYKRFVKPAYDIFISPMMKHADVIIPGGGFNGVALRMIVPFIQERLSERGDSLKFNVSPCNSFFSEFVHVLPQTREVLTLQTILRNVETAHEEFIFYSNRLMRHVFELVYGLLPFRDVEVETQDGTTYQGKDLDVENICAFSILRAGETMESAASIIFKNIVVGKVLIQKNHENDLPELHYLRLPSNAFLAKSKVLVLDCTVATGSAAIMAIRILLDHDVPQENIFLVSLIMAQQGVYNVRYAFPKVNIVTSVIDSDISDRGHILPGMGNFGDRYFGTSLSRS